MGRDFTKAELRDLSGPRFNASMNNDCIANVSLLATFALSQWREIERLRRALRRADNDLMYLAGLTAPLAQNERLNCTLVDAFKVVSNRITRALAPATMRKTKNGKRCKT